MRSERHWRRWLWLLPALLPFNACYFGDAEISLGENRHTDGTAGFDSGASQWSGTGGAGSGAGAAPGAAAAASSGGASAQGGSTSPSAIPTVPVVVHFTMLKSAAGASAR